jgi:hypothetical protein
MPNDGSTPVVPENVLAITIESLQDSLQVNVSQQLQIEEGCVDAVEVLVL